MQVYVHFTIHNRNCSNKTGAQAMNLIPITSKQIREANTEFLLEGSFGLDRYWHVMYANMHF